MSTILGDYRPRRVPSDKSLHRKSRTTPRSPGLLSCLWEKAEFREESSCLRCRVQNLSGAFTGFDQGPELFKVVDDKIRT